MRRTTRRPGIYKIKDGVFQVRVSYKAGVDKDGKAIYKQKAKVFKGSLDEAQAFQSELNVLYKGRVAMEGKKSLSTLCERYLEHCEVHLSPSTVRNYKSIYTKHVSMSFGFRNIDDIYPDDLDRWFALLNQSLAPSTVNQVRAFLSGAYRQGVKWGWCRNNPVGDTTAMRKRRVTKPLPSTMAIESVLGYFKTSKTPEVGLALRVLLGTQMRRGELCALRVSSWDGTNLWVKETVVIGPGGSLTVKDYTKNGLDRVFPVEPGTAAILDELCTGKFGNEFIFGGTQHWNPQRITRAFDRAKKSLGLNFRVHDLRAYTTTLLVAAGWSKEAQVNGGWKDEAVMRRHYILLNPEGQTAATQMLSSHFGEMNAEKTSADDNLHTLSAG